MRLEQRPELVGGRHGRQLRCRLEERLHREGRLERDQYPPGGRAIQCPGVGHAAWGQDGVARPEAVEVPSHLDKVVALDYVEPLILFEVLMSRWATLVGVVLFDDEKAAACVSRGDFDAERHDAEHAALLAEPITPRRHVGTVVRIGPRHGSPRRLRRAVERFGAWIVEGGTAPRPDSRHPRGPRRRTSAPGPLARWQYPEGWTRARRH